MLRKFSDTHPSGFIPGTAIYLVTRKGEIIEGYQVGSQLAEMVLLDRAPQIPGEPVTGKQGFEIEGDLLKPTWCAGRRHFVAGCRSRDEAENIAKKRRR